MKAKLLIRSSLVVFIYVSVYLCMRVYLNCVAFSCTIQRTRLETKTTKETTKTNNELIN